MKLYILTGILMMALGLTSKNNHLESVAKSITDTPKHKTDSVYVILYDKRDTVPVFMEVVKRNSVVCINGYIIQKGFVTQTGQWAKEPTVVEALDEKKRPLPNKILRVYQPDYNLNPVKDSLIKKGGKK